MVAALGRSLMEFTKAAVRSMVRPVCRYGGRLSIHSTRDSAGISSAPTEAPDAGETAGEGSPRLIKGLHQSHTWAMLASNQVVVENRIAATYN